MFDIFVQRFLRHAWTNYSADLASFKRLFAGINFVGNVESLLEEWFTALSPQDYVVFRTAYNLDQRQFPQVIVGLSEEPIDNQPLGFFAGIADNGDTIYSSLVNQTVVVKVFGSPPEHVRVLHEFVRQAMMTGVRHFTRIGFVGLNYQAGTDLELDVEAMPELTGITVRAQRWSTVYQASVTQTTEAEASSVFVHISDVTVDGISGGITPLEE